MNKFKNTILKMARRAIADNRTPITQAQIKEKQRKGIKALFTRREWNRLRIDAVIAKNKEKGLGMCGAWRPS